MFISVLACKQQFLTIFGSSPRNANVMCLLGRDNMGFLRKIHEQALWGHELPLENEL